MIFIFFKNFIWLLFLKKRLINFKVQKHEKIFKNYILKVC